MTRKTMPYVLFVAVAAVAGAWIWLSLLRHYRLASTQDLALFDQLLWNVRQGHGLWTTLSGNSWLQFPHHFFGEHVAPILYLLAWPAALSPGPEALLVFQALAVALAALPAARIVAEETGRPAAGLLAGLVWLALPGIWAAVLFDFHMESFGPLFLFAFWLAFRRGRPASWLWAVLYIACKEDAPIYLALVAGLGGFITGRRRLGIAIALAAAAYALVVWLWVQPACSPSGRALLGQRLLLPSQAGELAGWLRAQFFCPSRWQALGRHLLAFGFLPLLGGLALLPWGVSLGAMWLSSDFEQAHGLLHYPLTFYPLMFLAAAAGLRHVGSWLAARNQGRRVVYALAGTACLAGLALGWNSQGTATRKATGFGNSAALRRAPEILAVIPPDGRVCAALTLTPHLSRRRHLEVLMAPDTAADWIATRLDGVVYPCRDHDHWLTDRLLADDSDYGVCAVDPQLLAVFKRGHPTDRNRALREQWSATAQAENLHHQTGRNTSDWKALNGLARMFAPRDPDRFAVFGSYRDLPAGAYRVDFRIRTRAVRPGDFAVLEVSENRGRSSRARTAIGASISAYTNITLTAVLAGAGGVEFRILKTGPGYLWADQITWQAAPPTNAVP